MEENAMKKYYGTIEEKPVPEDVEAPPEGAVYVGVGADIPEMEEGIYMWFGCMRKWRDKFNSVGCFSDHHYALPADSPYLKRSPWITDRLPTAEDTDEGELGACSYVAVPESDNAGWLAGLSVCVKLGDPWAPYPKLPPYVSPEETDVATAETTLEDRVAELEKRINELER